MGFFLGLIVGLALMIIGYLIMPKPKANKPEQMSEMDAPTAEAGRPIPVMFGEMLIKSPNFLWWGDKYFVKKQRNGKKK